MNGQLFIGLSISLGIGLLIGAERERRKGSGPTRASAGIRTFALASLTGAISVAVGGPLLLGVTTLAVGALSVLGYARSNSEDPGITSELARPRIGLPLTGLTSGFVSSIATIGSMGTRVARQAGLLRPAVAGAILSTVSTVVQLIVVLWVTNLSTLAALWIPLGLAGLTASLYGVIFMRLAARKISVADAVPIVLPGFTTNTISKVVIAATTGGRQFALGVVPGLILVLGAAWLGNMLRF